LCADELKPKLYDQVHDWQSADPDSEREIISVPGAGISVNQPKM
jgi:hypothetical protein